MSESFIAHIYFHEATELNTRRISLYCLKGENTHAQFKVFGDWRKSRKIQLTCLVIIFHFWKKGGELAESQSQQQTGWCKYIGAPPPPPPYAFAVKSANCTHIQTHYDPPPSHKSSFDIKPNLSTNFIFTMQRPWSSRSFIPSKVQWC